MLCRCNASHAGPGNLPKSEQAKRAQEFGFSLLALHKIEYHETRVSPFHLIGNIQKIPGLGSPAVPVRFSLFRGIIKVWEKRAFMGEFEVKKRAF